MARKAEVFGWVGSDHDTDGWDRGKIRPAILCDSDTEATLLLLAQKNLDRSLKREEVLIAERDFFDRERMKAVDREEAALERIAELEKERDAWRLNSRCLIHALHGSNAQDNMRPRHQRGAGEHVWIWKCRFCFATTEAVSPDDMKHHDGCKHALVDDAIEFHKKTMREHPDAFLTPESESESETEES